jgi:uncharacterized protein with NRDE domain
MCLVVLAFRAHDDVALVVAANRDEFHARPTRDAGWWPDAPDVLAGRDLQAGGTWLGVHRCGRFATVTNYRDADSPAARYESRGNLVAAFLQGDQRPIDFLHSVDADAYAGFNLLLSDGDSLAYLSNRGGGLQELPPGIYGLSNATLDTPWEKVERSKRQLADLVEKGQMDETALLRLLADREKGPTSEVRSERLPFATAHSITAPFIVMPDYGTRCSTVVRRDRDAGWHFLERRFDADGEASGDTRVSFSGAVDPE